MKDDQKRTSPAAMLAMSRALAKQAEELKKAAKSD